MTISDADWLGAIKKISEIRSERITKDALLEYYVEDDQLEILKTTRNEIIFGRRGTGKTHLLRALKEFYEANFETEGVIPVFLDLQTVKGTPRLPTASPREKADFLFRECLRDLSRQLIEFADIHFTPTLYQKITGTGHANLKAKVEEQLLELDDLVKFGEPAYYEGTTVVKDSTSEHARKKYEGRVKSGVGKNLTLDLSGSMEGDKVTTDDRKTESAAKSQNLLKPTSVRSLVEDMLSRLKVSRLLIIIDEWVEMDQETQPEFAELLKRHFFGSANVTVKLSANWMLTRVAKRLARGELRGIQIGDDIFECCDLDRVNFGRLFSGAGASRNAHQFFKELLFKRLIAHLPSLSQYRRGEDIDDAFINLIFDHSDAYTEMVRASHANPRDFLNLFIHIAYELSGRFNERRITTAHVRKAARAWCRMDKIGTELEASSVRLLRTILDDIHSQEMAIAFCIEPGLLQDYDLQDLLEKRLIHLIPHEHLPSKFRSLYESFLIDYGYYSDFIEEEDETLFRPISDQYSKFPRWRYAVFEAAKFRKHRSNTEAESRCYFCRVDLRLIKDATKIRGGKKICPECLAKIQQVKKGLKL